MRWAYHRSHAILYTPHELRSRSSVKDVPRCFIKHVMELDSYLANVWEKSAYFPTYFSRNGITRARIAASSHPEV
jgi:hypothetical protein